MGNKLLPIDSNQVRELAGIGCTMKEIGLIVGCSVDTLETRFPDEVKIGRAKVSESLRRRQLKLALAEGNPTMLIWLGKQLLGQTDKRELDSKVNVQVAFQPHIHGPVLTDPKLRAQALELEESIEQKLLEVDHENEEGQNES